jgi:hypothetical protein
VSTTKSTKPNNGAARSTKKPLSMRYAEVLKLRQAIRQVEMKSKPRHIERQGSK